MNYKYMIVVFYKEKLSDGYYNRYASNMKELKEMISELKTNEKLLHIWEIKEVK